MPPITKRINAPAIATKVATAKSRAGDATAMQQAKLRARRDDLMEKRNTPAAKAAAAKATDVRKASTFTNNLAASKVVKKAEDVRKSSLFNARYAAQQAKPDRVPAAQARPSKAMEMRVARRGRSKY